MSIPGLKKIEDKTFDTAPVVPVEKKSQGWEWKCNDCGISFQTRRVMTERVAEEYFQTQFESHKRSGCRPHSPANKKVQDEEKSKIDASIGSSDVSASDDGRPPSEDQ